jgi:hypothetical protein
MSNLVFNIRFGGWFFQWRRSASLGNGRRITFERVPGRPGRGEPWFQIYEAPWL